MDALVWTGKNVAKIRKLTGKKVRVLDAELGPEAYIYLSDDEQLIVATGQVVVVQDDGSLSLAEVVEAE